MNVIKRQKYNSNGLCAHKFYLSKNLREPAPKTKDFCSVKCMTLKNFLMILRDTSSDPPPMSRMEQFIRPDGLKLFGELEVDFASTSELLYPVMKVKLRRIRTRPKFQNISDNPNDSLGIFACSLLHFSYHLQPLLSLEKERIACIFYFGVQLFRKSSKDFYHSYLTKAFTGS